MLPASTEFILAMKDNHNFKVRIDCTLADGTQLTITNANIRANSLSFEKAVSGDSSFDIGSFIVGKLSLTLNNVPGTYTGMDFDGAVLTLSFANHLNGKLYPSRRLYPGTKLYPGQITSQYVRLGIYTVVETKGRNGAWIGLTAYDNASLFQVPLSDVGATFPCTASALVSAICSHVGVPVGTIPSALASITIPALSESVTPNCLQAIAWCAMMAGTNATIDATGQLAFQWYDAQTMASVRADVAQNGWEGADLSAVHQLDALINIQTMTEDVSVTGISVTYTGSEGEEVTTPIYGAAGYVINVAENAFVNEDNVETIAQNVANALVGMTFRPFDATMMGNPLLEPGDVIYFTNRKGQTFLSVLTSMSYTLGGYMTVLCGAEAPTKQSAQSYSATVRVIQQTQAMAKKAVEKVAERVGTIEATAVTGVVVQYAKGDSSTTVPTSGWSASTPVWEAGKYIWQRTVTTIDGEQLVSNTACIQGAKGEKGDNGTSVTILGSYSTYADLIAAHPTGSLGDAYMVGADLYVWSGSAWEDVGQIRGPQGPTGPQGPQGETGATGPAGAAGADGVGIRSITPYYYLSTSSTAQTGGEWSTTPQSYVSGCYYWTKSLITWTDGTTAWTTAVLDNATTDANSNAYQALRTAGNAEDIAEATSQHFWADTDGVHVSSEADLPTATRNAIFNSLGMLFRKGANILLGILTGTNPRVAIYDGQGNSDDHIVASFGADETRVGSNASDRVLLTPGNIKMVSESGYNTLLIGATGAADSIGQRKTYRASSAGSNVIVATYNDSQTIRGITVSINGTATTNYTYTEIANVSDGTIDVVITVDTSVLTSGDDIFAQIALSGSIYSYDFGPRGYGDKGGWSIAGGNSNVASGYAATAFGFANNVSGNNAAAFGSQNRASEDYSVAVGAECYANGESSFAGGSKSNASDDYAFAYGRQASAGLSGSVAMGEGVKASTYNQAVFGKYNIEDDEMTEGGVYAFIIGNGSSDSRRSNAFAVTWNGDIVLGRSPITTVTGSTVTAVNNTPITVATITLGKGNYILTGCAHIEVNTTGSRAIRFSLSDAGSAVDDFAALRMNGIAGGVRTLLLHTWAHEVTADSETLYLVVNQSSGSDLTVYHPGIRAVRVG